MAWLRLVLMVCNWFDELFASLGFFHGQGLLSQWHSLGPNFFLALQAVANKIGDQTFVLEVEKEGCCRDVIKARIADGFYKSDCTVHTDVENFEMFRLKDPSSVNGLHGGFPCQAWFLQVIVDLKILSHISKQQHAQIITLSGPFHSLSGDEQGREERRYVGPSVMPTESLFQAVRLQ